MTNEPFPTGGKAGHSKALIAAYIAGGLLVLFVSFYVGAWRGGEYVADKLDSGNLVTSVVATVEARYTQTPRVTPAPLEVVISTPAAPATPPYGYSYLPPEDRVGVFAMQDSTLPTATLTPDIVLTELFYSAKSGIRVILEVDASARVTISPDAFPVCNANYAGICLPHDYPHLICQDLGDFSFAVVGVDQYGLDADQDGAACEDNE